VFKLGIGNDLGIQVIWFWVERSKVKVRVRVRINSNMAWVLTL